MSALRVLIFKIDAQKKTRLRTLTQLIPAPSMTVDRFRTELKKLVGAPLFYPALALLFAVLAGWVFWVRTGTDLAVYYTISLVTAAGLAIIWATVRADHVSARHTDVVRMASSDEESLSKVVNESSKAITAGVALTVATAAAYALHKEHETVSHVILTVFSLNCTGRSLKTMIDSMDIHDTAVIKLYFRNRRQHRGRRRTDSDSRAHAHE